MRVKIYTDEYDLLEELSVEKLKRALIDLDREELIQLTLDLLDQIDEYVAGHE